MELKNLHELFVLQIKDLYSAESQITEALPKMISKVHSKELKEAFDNHLNETENPIERLEEIAENLGIEVEGHMCKGMEGLIEEGEEILKTSGNSSVIDAGLISAAQKVEHYEISAYGTAVELAKLMNHHRESDLLEESLKEEKRTDEKLSKIAKDKVNPNAPGNE